MPRKDSGGKRIFESVLSECSIDLVGKDSAFAERCLDCVCSNFVFRLDLCADLDDAFPESPLADGDKLDLVRPLHAGLCCSTRLATMQAGNILRALPVSGRFAPPTVARHH